MLCARGACVCCACCACEPAPDRCPARLHGSAHGCPLRAHAQACPAALTTCPDACTAAAARGAPTAPPSTFAAVPACLPAPRTVHCTHIVRPLALACSGHACTVHTASAAPPILAWPDPAGALAICRRLSAPVLDAACFATAAVFCLARLSFSHPAVAAPACPCGGRAVTSCLVCPGLRLTKLTKFTLQTQYTHPIYAQNRRVSC